MEALLRAVGLSSALPIVSCGRARSAGLAGEDGSSSPRGAPGLPDMAAVAASTERGVVALEEEAKSLERATLAEALALIRKWTQGLRRKPRPDDPPASLRAQFLRSNALERTLEALRRNEALKAELLDPPLFVSTLPEDSLEAELRAALQLCLPRAASGLSGPVLRAVLTERPEGCKAALMAVRLLKEDWTEVVQAQAVRALERHLDSLAYELQKTPVAPKGGRPAPRSGGASAARRASRGRVAALARLCEALEASQRRAEARWTEVRAALAGMGVEVSADLALVRARSERHGGRETPSEAEAAGDNVPSASDCEAAVAAMVAKTQNGMQEGLRLLGLPTTPLHFVPGQELRLCGHDIRVAINAMIQHWLEDERAEFYCVLLRVRRIVEQRPCGQQLLTMSPSTSRGEDTSGHCVSEQSSQELRQSLLEERASLLERVRRIDERLAELDAQQEQQQSPNGCFTPHGPAVARAPTPSPSPSFVTLLATGVPSGLEALSGPPTSRSRGCATPPPPLPAELVGPVTAAAEAIAVEVQRTRDRLAAQLQLRRGQLLSCLEAHLEWERDRVEGLAASLHKVAASGTAGPARVGAVAAMNQELGAALHDVRRLCGRAEASAGGRGAEAHSSGQGSCRIHGGQRCRAKWLDGNYYDATVQKVGEDGTVVVNWLRPTPAVAGEQDSDSRPLVTISEAGGDDSLHRIVLQADVQTEEVDSAGHSEATAALRHFRERAAEDLLCADCGEEGPEWASVSFGIYLCTACAEEHRQLGVRASYVRPLNDGWGWDRRDLQYLSRGGNAAFRAQLAKYPGLKAAPVAQRYTSRFAEYYRRSLDARCTGGTTPPPPPAPDVGHEPLAGEFTTAAEVAAAVRGMARHFEEAVAAISLQHPVPTSMSFPPLEDGGAQSARSLVPPQPSRIGRVRAC